MKYYENRIVKVTAYPHKLNRSLVFAFVALVEAYYATRRPLNAMTDLGLTHNQKANFQKLKHFGIVYNVKDGEWLPTMLGFQFYHGEVAIWDTAASIGNDTLGYDHECWKTHTRELQKIKITDLYSLDRKYASREEYREHKRETLFDNI